MMKRITAIAVTVAAILGTSYVGSASAATPTDYDQLQDIGIKANDNFDDYQQAKIVKNENDIRDLANNTARQFDQVNHYVDSVQQQSNDHDKAQDSAIVALQKAPKPADGKDGKDGAAGATGKAGVKGDKGDTGATGAAGLNGAVGATGAAGRNGRNGKDVSPAVAKQVQANASKLRQHDQQIDDLKHDVKGIGNNAAAMSSLHFNGNRDSWAISTGSYNADGAAFAGGLQKSIGEHLATTVQASFDGEGNTMIGAGLHGDF